MRRSPDLSSRDQARKGLVIFYFLGGGGFGNVVCELECGGGFGGWWRKKSQG